MAYSHSDLSAAVLSLTGFFAARRSGESESQFRLVTGTDAPRSIPFSRAERKVD